MDLQDLGAIGEVVGGVGVVVSLVYVAYQIRQNSSQIELNSRHLEASMYQQTGDAFSRWWALLAQDEALVDIWRRGMEGEELTETEELRFNYVMAIMFNAYENNHRQVQLGSIARDTLVISQGSLRNLLASPRGARWWESWAPIHLTSEFRSAVEEITAAP